MVAASSGSWNRSSGGRSTYELPNGTSELHKVTNELNDVGYLRETKCMAYALPAQQQRTRAASHT